ncbi:MULTISPECIES: DUF2332 domain-containing protein [Mycobacterium]|uniref:DUF2332 domain-containing protein n=1 Tax=Mycobacterium kiyosense TaxID=2871094 RepID=A0A9P3Q8Z7_9MYCO|nr:MULTISPECIES: DUF2332 family protein [Mycobacterium]BDB40565.1 hypothetical protein IWGMT90018_10110 [Mycobacterium kiyosense]BDE12381.1 hypothetical protein MKCMC460_12410 [Mycobacterium sp. 20KCMC460]GLB85557.1 hypothetical protein SRL2020028_48130 [Mycobacterium kiyosense]GLB88618.1 hypothetical protein SRL2020130_14350 [Mycobacterium kiyosense]GLB98892.1 hypothetical protein SRL2020226_56680 [Mycobacterium kiyosense]
MSDRHGTEHLLHTLRSQGRFCAGSGSPMYGELFERVAADVAAGGEFAGILAGYEDAPSRHAVPLRLLGGLHRMVLEGRAADLRRWYPSAGGRWDAQRAWPEIVRVAAEHAGVLRAALTAPPQTNEVGRSAALIGGLRRLTNEFGLPVRLFEIGCSAGLNLRADHYHYRFTGGRWGPQDSPVLLEDAWRGELPPAGEVRIVERRGFDIAPLDVTGTDGELTVLSYVWPDQDARLRRLRGAIAVAREVPAQLERRTAGAAVTGLTLADGALTVLWHSVTWQYLPAEEQTTIREAVGALAAAATSRAPLAHLTMEPARDGPGAPLKFLVRLASWPRGGNRVLAECHAHGPPVHWQ